MKDRKAIYDDKTLENMKHYYKIASSDVLLKYMKRNGLVDDSECESYPLLDEEIQ